jgi:transcriptional regulator with XRE-family HTH domain
MKQPELGQKIAQIRKQKVLTQDELVERCNVSIRTIQRIESGEVTPRISTIRIILAALDTDVNEIMQDNEDLTWWQKTFLVGFNTDASKDAVSILQTAWIAGIIYFAVGLVEAGMDYLHFKGDLQGKETILFIATKVSILISYFFFIRGFIALGTLFENYLLKISSYLVLGISLVVYGYEIIDVINHFDEEFYMSFMIGASILFGGTTIILGMGLWRLQDAMGRIALFAGILEIVIGVCFLVVILVVLGYLTMIPATIIEIVMMYKAYEFMAKEKVINPTPQNAENFHP